jgi:hypothetical protein
MLGVGIAGAAPTPKYTVTCVVGDRTVAQWQRASVSRVTFDWAPPVGSTTTYAGVSAPVAARPPHGTVTVGTATDPVAGVSPATATVTFTPADGSPPAVVVVSCS